MTAAWRLWVRNAERERVAVVTTFTRFECVIRLNGAGSWLLDLPADCAAAAELVPKAGVILARDGVIVMSGVVRRTQVRRDVDGATLEVSGIDDTGQLADRWAAPDPNGPPYVSSHHTIDAEAERQLHDYVDANAGPLAIAARRIPGLVMGTNSGRGSRVPVSARFDNLLVFCQQIAVRDGLRFQVRQTAAGLEFQTSMPADKRAGAVFGFERRNLDSLEVTEEAPLANHIVGFGKGESDARDIQEQGDSESISRYGRIEGGLDARSAANPTALLVSITTELAASSEVIDVKPVPKDTEALTAFRDYDVGDWVTTLIDGVATSGYVTELEITLDQHGVTLTPTITAVPMAARPRGGRLSSAERRVAFLERNAENLSVGVALYWLGAIADIPQSYHLCDGTNGTPELRGQFLVGAGGALSQLETGGSDTAIDAHTHGAAHTHPGEHLHGTVAHTHDVVITHGHGGITGDPSAVTGRGGGANDTPTATHEHVIVDDSSTKTSTGAAPATTADNTAHAASISQTGSAGSSHDNRPRFTAVAIIMRISA